MEFREGHTVGIDLGTTFSCIAYLDQQGNPIPLANDEDEVETPSLLLLGETGSVIVGPPRTRAAMEDPEHVIERIDKTASAPSTGTGQDTVERQAELEISYSIAHALADVGRADEARLLAARATGATGAPADSTSNSVSLFVIVISPDTLDWLDHPSDPSYFPARRDVSEIADIIWSYGAMGRLVGDAFVLSLRCN